MADAAHAAPAPAAPSPASGRIAGARLAIGFAQGVAIWALTETASRKVWPATDAPVFGAFALALGFAPVIVIGGLGRIRPIALAAWTFVAAIAVAILGWHDLDVGIWSGVGSTPVRLAPAFPVVFFSAVFVFIGHHLVGPASEAKKLVAPYPSYFDWAWKDGVQVALSAAFVGVLWIALELGSALFKLIGIEALGKLVEQRWFAIPVTTTAFAAAVQLTDVRVMLIRGVRTVGLVLLSWLLPVMTVIVLAFLAALAFTGLAPLFGTRAGAATVLSAAAALILLVSAAYEDGESPTHVVLRWAGRAAGLALVPLILIAADALLLRVRQYGLTPERIAAIACAVVGAGFAAGYAVAALRGRGAWMRPLELTNLVMAPAAMLAILLLFTPLADPARLSADDQVGRLLAGKTDPASFDFSFLTYRAGRYGTEALARLAALKGSPRNVQIAQFAARGQAEQTPEAPAKPAVLTQLWRVFAIAGPLPDSFLAAGDVSSGSPDTNCFLPNFAADCDAYVVDIDASGAPEVLLTQDRSDAGVDLGVYKQVSGHWARIGDLHVQCADAVAALRAGQVKLVPRQGRDLELAGRRISIAPPQETDCGPTAQPPAANAAAQR